MFTGIVESVGSVRRVTRMGTLDQISVENESHLGKIRKGASLSINGACLTFLDRKSHKDREVYEFEVSGETLLKTNLKLLKKGSRVNIERALPADGRFEGHIVLGHVDGTVKLSRITNLSGGERIFEFTFDPGFGEMFVEKGSVALNGVSLTCFDLKMNSFKAVILPYTFEKTNLRFLKTGDEVNFEGDLLGKYVKRIMEKQDKPGRISYKFLAEHGFLGGSYAK